MTNAIALTATDAQILALETAAAEAGDIAQVVLCRFALDRDLTDLDARVRRDTLADLSPTDARRLCQMAIRNGQG